MSMTELFQAELDREAASTRRVLERVPEGRNDWKPHEKSMPLGYLAALVATMPSWVAMMIQQDELDFTQRTKTKFHTQVQANREDLLKLLDRSVKDAREALAGTNDEHLLRNWRFRVGDHVVDERPCHIMMRDAVFSHLAHHRGQLTVYLRLNNAPVPAIYGPSADEGKM